MQSRFLCGVRTFVLCRHYCCICNGCIAQEDNSLLFGKGSAAAVIDNGLLAELIWPSTSTSDSQNYKQTAKCCSEALRVLQPEGRLLLLRPAHASSQFDAAALFGVLPTAVRELTPGTTAAKLDHDSLQANCLICTCNRAHP